jgi:hypothetical protein
MYRVTDRRVAMRCPDHRNHHRVTVPSEVRFAWCASLGSVEESFISRLGGLSFQFAGRNC